MRDRPEFDSTEPMDMDELTVEERATFDERLRRLAELRAAEDDVPDL